MRILSRILVIFFCNFLALTAIQSQKFDYFWVFGYSGDDLHPQLEASNLDFNFSPPKIFPSNRDLSIGGIGSAICDDMGNLIAFTNGVKIYNNEEKLMTNGDSLDIGFCFEDYYDDGFPYFQSAFWLPSPGEDSSFWLFHFSCTNSPTLIERGPFLMTKIVKSNGEYIVSSEKNIQVYNGNFDYPSACKHANGRDWWIVVPNNISENTNYYIFLFTPEGIIGPKIQMIGVNNQQLPSGGIKTGFSKDGNKFVRTDAFLGLQFMDFDRCTGSFSNFQFFDFEGSNNSLSAAGEFSPNGQFYYFTKSSEIYQLNLFADTLNWNAVDTVAIYDGFTEWGTFTSFFMCQRGPDDKIYISCSTTAPYLHVIHSPDIKGENCNVEQHAIKLAGRHTFSIPYYPNYRLGPLENSPCDTISSAQETFKTQEIDIKIFPNPAHSMIDIVIEKVLVNDFNFKIVDSYGRTITKAVFSGNSMVNTLDLSNVKPGIYFYQLSSKSELLQTGKIIVK